MQVLMVPSLNLCCFSVCLFKQVEGSQLDLMKLDVAFTFLTLDALTRHWFSSFLGSLTSCVCVCVSCLFENIGFRGKPKSEKTTHARTHTHMLVSILTSSPPPRGSSTEISGPLWSESKPWSSTHPVFRQIRMCPQRLQNINGLLASVKPWLQLEE